MTQPRDGHEAALITGLHHVQLAMPRGGEPDARAFYAGVIGLDEVSKPAQLAGRGGCWFRSATLELHLGVEEPFHPAKKAHPALLTHSLGEVERRLRAAGCVIKHDEQLCGYERFYAADPFGNRLEFLARVVD
jgi:catechol 2,3-dioxygenase-like lactoylglutathione lyase family enzyme